MPIDMVAEVPLAGLSIIHTDVRDTLLDLVARG
jgi:hypothetical protein